jgi:hypothetical protein
MSPIYHERICSQRRYKYNVWAVLQLCALCTHDMGAPIVIIIRESLYNMTIPLLISCYNMFGYCVVTILRFIPKSVYVN